MPPTITRHHAEWLSLLEISGPFLSMPVLLTIFPQGLDDYPPEEARSLRADYEYWKENAVQAGDTATHTAWVRLVLESMLGYTPKVLLSGQAIPTGLKAEFPEHDETLRPEMMLADPSTHKPRMLIQVYPPSQNLEKAIPGCRWQSSVATRMMELLHATEIRLGLVTNGEQWMLVDAPRGETTGFSTWYANLWFDEPITLRAFRSLLGARRFFGVPDEETLEFMLAKSTQDQHEVTDQLGLQVRHAVEILIQSLDRADQEQGRRLLGVNLPPALLYEAALTVMMRLVFMLAAEERKLLPVHEERYLQYYAASTLREQLQAQADQLGEEVLELRYDAWSRLLAVFRAVYGGVKHQDLHSPAYGGSLFNPDRFPFLEGRTHKSDPAPALPEPGKGKKPKSAKPLPVDNRTVLHLLNALQMLQVRMPGGGQAETRRLSFRALDVEQIGHVYEGLLDHIAMRASEPVLGLAGTKNNEPEVTLAEIEKSAKRGETALLDWLKEQTGRSVSALKNGLAAGSQKEAEWLGRLRSVCGSDETLYQSVLPFAGLLREDDLGFPVVILPGSVYVTAGTTRRATGTHYTQRVLTEPIVQHTLEVLVYEGPAEGWPRAQWRLRTPAEILALKICDLAMGSGGFIVQVVRYLAERLVESWALYGEDSAGGKAADVAVFYHAAAGLSPEDRLLYARRLVAERCVYGVDKNPLAVEIAKLSLWLVTLSKDLPFTFLDHALKCGDSLVGVSAEAYLRWANRKKIPAMALDQEILQKQLDQARDLRKQLESFLVRDVQDAARKTALLQAADAAAARVKRGADLLTGLRLQGLKPQEVEDGQVRLVDPYLAGELDGEIDSGKYPLAVRALTAARKERVFHWEFEFPEVFEQGGFSAFVGNPPFIGGGKISTLFGSSYLEYLHSAYPEYHGVADLCALFFTKAFLLIKAKGTYGFIATNTIAQGDTRDAGLDYVVQNKGVIYHAISSMPWPGSAAVSVSIVHVSKGNSLQKILNGEAVDTITSFLDQGSFITPNKIPSNSNQAFNGSKIYGQGFIIEDSFAQELTSKNEKYKKVVFPYLIGDDITSRFDQSPSRLVINFFDWTLEEAENYPECLEIVRQTVLPERLAQNREIRRRYWWRYGEVAPALYRSIVNLKRVIVVSLTAKYLCFVLAPSNFVYSHSCGVIARDNWASFACLQNSFHDAWARTHGSTLETRLRYTPADCFETFPFPHDLTGLEEIGELYHETRRKIMFTRQEGLTATYNRFHNPEDKAADIRELRRLHTEMDMAVTAAYGWSDLELGHDFHETAQGVRYSISESARREVLSRLLKLNHERYEEEQKQAESHAEKKSAQGKAASKGKKGKSAQEGSPKGPPFGQGSLF